MDKGACLAVKNIGKPCAGKPHARFDEGGQEKSCSLLYPEFQVIKIPVLETKELTAIVAKVEALEKQIAEAQAVIDAAPASKEAVMKKYL